jgi:hypothetical protein
MIVKVPLPDKVHIALPLTVIAPHKKEFLVDAVVVVVLVEISL